MTPTQFNRAQKIYTRLTEADSIITSLEAMLIKLATVATTQKVSIKVNDLVEQAKENERHTDAVDSATRMIADHYGVPQIMVRWNQGDPNSTERAQEVLLSPKEMITVISTILTIHQTRRDAYIDQLRYIGIQL